MNESPQAKTKRFRDAIRQKLSCEAVHEYDKERDASPHSAKVGVISLFKLPHPPDKNQAAKQCLVWDSRDFKAGENQVVIVLDVEVLSDPDSMIDKALSSWLEEQLVDHDSDIYVRESDNWTIDKLLNLHDCRVEFGAEKEAGTFFVRTRADGRVSVRVALDFRSVPLSPAAIERIELEDSRLELYTLRLP